MAPDMLLVVILVFIFQGLVSFWLLDRYRRQVDAVLPPHMPRRKCEACDRPLVKRRNEFYYCIHCGAIETPARVNGARVAEAKRE